MKVQELGRGTLRPAPEIHLIEPNFLQNVSVREGLFAHGHAVKTHMSGTQFLSTLNPASSGCVIMDLKQDTATSGIDFLESLQRLNTCLEVVFLTDESPFTRNSQLAGRMGAFTCLHKPCSSERIQHVIALAMQQSAKRTAAR